MDALIAWLPAFGYHEKFAAHTRMAVASLVALASVATRAGPAQTTPAPVVGTAIAHGTVRTDTVWSQSLGIHKALRVYLPPSYATNSTKRYPVLFYLHGLSGAENDWVHAGHLDSVMDSMVAAGQPEALVAMPDGDDGWWTTANMFADTPACRIEATRKKEPAATYCVPWLHYDDYVARDLVAYIDTHFRTFRTAATRGIGGLSMGGYGAITLALNYPDVFAAAASHSGVLAPSYLGPKPYAEPAQHARDSVELRTAAGGLWSTQRIAFGVDTLGWWARDPGRIVVRALARRRPGGAPLPALQFDAGVNDPYIEENRAFHATLDRLGVSHSYAEWPGTHSWMYWRAHLPESIAFLLAHTSAAAGP
jgi:S-formylglutathione hydrolase FrmB